MLYVNNIYMLKMFLGFYIFNRKIKNYFVFSCKEFKKINYFCVILFDIMIVKSHFRK